MRRSVSTSPPTARWPTRRRDWSASSSSAADLPPDAPTVRPPDGRLPLSETPMTRLSRPPIAPLYDPAFEHDACGIGFVADAGGRNAARVLPLALRGLASLAHRGAFAADGESSDGAGIALPLEVDLLALIAGAHGPARPAVVFLFLPRGRTSARRSRELVRAA